MPAPTIKDVEILLSTATYGGVAQPMCVGYSWRYTRTHIPIRGQGSVNPDQQGLVARMLALTIQFLGQPQIPDTDTAANMVIVTKTCEANAAQTATVTETLSNLITAGLAKQVNRESPPFVYEQDFICKGVAGAPVEVGS